MEQGEALARGVYTFVHSICYSGVAVAINPTVPEAQHLSLLPSTRWAPAEEHAKLRMSGPPRGAFKAQGVGIIAMTLSAFPAAATLTEQRFPAFAQAVDTLDEMSIQGWHSGADGAYWQRCAVDLTHARPPRQSDFDGRC